MKTKLILLMLLSLFAVQGWASLLDSLETHVHGNLIHSEFSNLNLSDGISKFDGFDGLTVVDHTKDIVNGDMSWLEGLLEELFKNLPGIHIAEIDANENFIDVPIGSSVTKRYEIWGKNVYSFDNIKLDLCIKPQGTYEIYSDDFFVDKTTFRGSDIDINEGGHRETITVTYKPTAVGSHRTKLDFRAVIVDIENNVVGLEVDCVEWPPAKFNLSGNAVERHFKASGSLSFVEQTVGIPETLPIHVTGSNLNGPLTVELEDETEMYSLDKTHLSVDDVENGTDVLVTFCPKLSGLHGAMITISEEGISETVKLHIFGSAVERHVTASALSSFRTLTVGESDTIPIHVTGTNLNGPLTVKLDDNNTGMFSISKDRIDADDAANGDDVLLIYTPTTVGTHGVSVDVCGGGALEYASVVLTGHCEPPTHIITVDHSTLNFGTVVKGDTPPTKSFTVKGVNLTNDLVLSLSPECSHYTVIPQRITPAEAKDGKEVTVTYHPSVAGTHNIYLKIDEEGMYQGGQLVNLQGKCVANPTITVNTTSLEFDPIEAGKTAKKTINVTGSDLAGSISVRLEETVSGQFSINKETLPASGGSVIVTYHPTEGGTHGGRVRISSDGATAKSVTLTGSARELSVTKSSLDFGTTKKNGTVTRKFSVYGGNLSGNVTLSSSNAKFTVTPESITPAEAKVGKEVTVTYKPTAAGTHTGSIIVKASGVTPDTVSVSGKCAAISTNPTTYNFGNVAVGKPVTKEITITGANVTSSITISVEETEGGQVTINKNTLPSSGGIVTVSFKATDAKTFGAALRISGGSAEAVSVSLTGKGVTPTITRNKSEMTFTGSGITCDYVTITGTNLDDVISLEVTGSGRTHFTLSTSTINISDAADGKQVKVTCNPKNASSVDATLKISSPYATTKYVTLKYRKGSSGGEVQISSVEPEGESEEGNNEFMNGGSLEVMGTSTTTDVNELAMNFKVYAEGQNIIIESPVELSAIISDISGHAQSVNLQIGRNEFPVNASGIFIVRIREKTTKLMLK